MTHIKKLGLLALVSLFLFSPAVSHAQTIDGWDYDRILELRDELEDFEDVFWYEIADDDEAEDAIEYLVEYLEDIEIPEEQSVVIEPVSTSASVTEIGGSSYGTFVVRFDVTSVDDDILIPIGLQTESNGVTKKPDGKVGVDYALLGGVNQPLKMSATLTSTADLHNGHFVVEESDTETFTLTVTVDPSKTDYFAISVEGLNYIPDEGTYQFVEIDDDTDFTTKWVTIPEPSSLDTYRGYLNNQLFITTKNITEAAALSNCKLNAEKNPTSSIYCSWGTREIYRRDVAPTGTITTKTLTEGSSHVISGTAKNTPTVGISISNGDKVYGSGRITVNASGKWSVKVPALKAGTYTLSLYEEKDRVIATVSLTVEAKPQVLPASTKTPTTNVDSINEPLVLPAETSGGKSSGINENLSASAAVAFEELLEAFKEYLKSR